MNRLRITALAALWTGAIAVPLIFVQDSADPSSVKLAILVITSGVMLFLASLRIRQTGVIPSGPVILTGVLAVLLAVIHRYPGSDQAQVRTLQLLSASALFYSLAVFRFKPGRILLPLSAAGILTLLASIAVHSGGRLSGTLCNPNLAGAWAAAMVPVYLSYFRPNLSRSTIFAVGGAGLCTAVIILSSTRASMVALPAGLAAGFLLHRFGQRFTAAAAVVFLLFSAVLLFHVPRLPNMEGTMATRQVIWEGAAGMSAEKPLAGWGTGAFQAVFPLYRPSSFGLAGLPTITVHAHSDPGELLAENGIAGVLLWGAFWTLLFSSPGAAKGRRRWFAAALLICLIESLVSVSTRWTGQVALMALLSGGALRTPVRSLRLSGVFSVALALAAVLLAVLGGTAAVRDCIAHRIIFQALVRAPQAGSGNEVCQLCQEAVDLNPRNPYALLLLGSGYGLQAMETQDPLVRESLLCRQLDTYETLSGTYHDYGTMVHNRARAFMLLGSWEAACTDLTRLYLTRDHMKAWALDRLMYCMPLAGERQIFTSSALIHSRILLRQIQTGEDPEQSLKALTVVYSVAAVHSPDILPVIETRTDSVLSPLDQERVSSITGEIRQAAMFAPEDAALLEEYLAGTTVDLPGSEGAGFRPYRRALLSLMAADSGRTEYVEAALDLAELYHRSCRPLGDRFPGGSAVLIAPAEISAAAGGNLHVTTLGTVLMGLAENAVWNMNVRDMEQSAIHPVHAIQLLQVDPMELLPLAGDTLPESAVSVLYVTAVLSATDPLQEPLLHHQRLAGFARELGTSHGDSSVRIISRGTEAYLQLFIHTPGPAEVRENALYLRNLFTGSL